MPATSDHSRPTYSDLTVIVPTFNESANIDRLLAAIEANLAGARVIIVDDSPDESTHDASLKAGPNYTTLDIHFEHRPKELRYDKLSGAVVDGLELAKWETLAAVCDADLQHPLNTLRAMFEVMNSSGVDLVIGSRYVPGGSASGLDGPLRHTVSRMCTWLTKAVFPRRLRGVTDPMSGCFIVRRTVVNTDLLQAEGFKILLELLVTHQLTFAEVPLVFQPREAGDSKGDLDNGVKFLKQLVRLRLALGKRTDGQ